jgi:electron transfer flavoprotein alpha subunit
VREVLVARTCGLDPYTPDAYAAAASAVIDHAQADLRSAAAHLPDARLATAACAARMRKPLITDVTGITAARKTRPSSRPMFQGKLAAQVKPRGGTPALVTDPDRRVSRAMR